jgi:c-di-GMP-binding flagellar brake protein YcgR
MQGRPDRRRHERVQLSGKALLLVDPRRGLIGAKGHLVDLSEGGCQLRFRRHVDADLAGRVRLELAGKSLWFPVVTRHVVRDGDGWTVRCAFGALTTKKRETLRAQLFELSLGRESSLSSPSDAT